MIPQLTAPELQELTERILRAQQTLVRLQSELLRVFDENREGNRRLFIDGFPALAILTDPDYQDVTLVDYEFGNENPYYPMAFTCEHSYTSEPRPSAQAGLARWRMFTRLWDVPPIRLSYTGRGWIAEFHRDAPRTNLFVHDEHGDSKLRFLFIRRGPVTRDRKKR